MVSISGLNFTGATGVDFGPQAALTFKVLADDTITAQIPPVIPGGQLQVDVVVGTPSGTSTPTNASLFAYISAGRAWGKRHTVGLVLVLLAMVALGCAIPAFYGAAQATIARPVSWIASLLLLAAFIVVAGEGITDRWDGLFIDDRNKITLSRLQLVLWVVVIVSAFLALALANVVFRATDPLHIEIPAQIWGVLGISAISLVGSPLILSSKASQSPDPNEASTTTANVAKLDNAPTAAITNAGLVVVKTRPQYARWSDLFRGEETGNADYLDMSKVQMFFFTVVLVAAYAVAIFGTFASGGSELHSLPALDSSMVALLAISHGAYLTSKVVPHSQTGDS